MPSWIERWRDWIAIEPALPGVWRRRDGGFHVRARYRDPRTKKRLEVCRALPDVTRARDALLWLEAEVSRRRAGPSREIPQVEAYAGGVTAGAERLGTSLVSLSRWLARRA